MTRSVEVRESVKLGVGRVVEHLGAIVGYTTGVAFFSHTVAENNRVLTALIADASEFSGPGFLLPTRNHEVFCWCLENGLRLVAQATLMTFGQYSEPDGAWLPSILY